MKRNLLQASAAVAVAALLAGCQSSTQSAAGSVSSPTTPAASGSSAPTPAAQPTARLSAGSSSDAPTTAASATPAAAAKTTTSAPGSLPTSLSADVQNFPDPLYGVSLTTSTSSLTYQRAIDPTSASHALRSWVVNPFGPDLRDFDESGYTVHGNIDPSLVLAIATPDGDISGTALVDGVMRASGATDLDTPISAQTGPQADDYGLYIVCGEVTSDGRTLCAWSGQGPVSHTPLFGAMVVLSKIPTSVAEISLQQAFADLVK